MNGNASTPTGLVADDTSTEVDHRQRIQRASFNLDAAKEALRHRVTHETQEACFQIDEARRELGLPAQVDDEGISRGESLGQEDAGAP